MPLAMTTVALALAGWTAEQVLTCVVRRVFPGAGHFELVVPGQPAADAIVPLIAETLRARR